MTYLKLGKLISGSTVFLDELFWMSNYLKWLKKFLERRLESLILAQSER